MDSIPITLDLDLSIYGLNAIKKTAYKFGDRCHVAIEPISERQIRVILRAKRVLENPAYLSGEFQNELLDQDLRERVAEETRPIRDLLLAQSIFRSLVGESRI